MRVTWVIVSGCLLLPALALGQRFEPGYEDYFRNGDKVDQRLVIDRAESVVIPPLIRTHLWLTITDPSKKPYFQQSFRAMFDPSAVLTSFRMKTPIALNSMLTEMPEEFPQLLSHVQSGMSARPVRYFRYEFWVQDRSCPHDYKVECDVVQSLQASDTELFMPMIAGTEKAPLKWNVRIGSKYFEPRNPSGPLDPISIAVKSESQDGLTATICSEVASNKTEYVLGVIQCQEESLPPKLTGATEVFWISPDISNWYEFFGEKRSKFMVRKYHRFVARLDKGAKVGVQWGGHHGEFAVTTRNNGNSIAKLWAHQYMVQAPNLTSKSAWQIAKRNQITHWASWWTATKGSYSAPKGGNR